MDDLLHWRRVCSRYKKQPRVLLLTWWTMSFKLLRQHEQLYLQVLLPALNLFSSKPAGRKLPLPFILMQRSLGQSKWDDY